MFNLLPVTVSPNHLTARNIYTASMQLFLFKSYRLWQRAERYFSAQLYVGVLRHLVCRARCRGYIRRASTSLSRPHRKRVVDANLQLASVFDSESKQVGAMHCSCSRPVLRRKQMQPSLVSFSICQTASTRIATGSVALACGAREGGARATVGKLDRAGVPSGVAMAPPLSPT